MQKVQASLLGFRVYEALKPENWKRQHSLNPRQSSVE